MIKVSYVSIQFSSISLKWSRFLVLLFFCSFDGSWFSLDQWFDHHLSLDLRDEFIKCWAKKKIRPFFRFFFCSFFFFNKNWSQRVEAVHLDRRDCRLNFNPEALEKARANYGTGDQMHNGAASCFCFFSSAQSCRGRCDEPFRRGRVCECDPQCASYNTCCQDYQLQCRKRQNTHTQQQSGTVVEVAWVVVSLRPFSPMMFRYVALKRFSALHLLFITSTTYSFLHRCWCASLSHWECSHSEGWD